MTKEIQVQPQKCEKLFFDFTIKSVLSLKTGEIEYISLTLLEQKSALRQISPNDRGRCELICF